MGGAFLPWVIGFGPLQSPRVFGVLVGALVVVVAVLGLGRARWGVAQGLAARK